MKKREIELGEFCIIDWGNTSLTKKAYVNNGKYLAVSATGGDGRIDHFEHLAFTPVISAIGAQCGKLFLPGENFTAIKNTITLTPKKAGVPYESKYLYYLLSSLTLPRRGAGQPFISKGDLKKFKIFLPSLDEQRRIAKILDLVNHQIQKIETQLNKTTQIENSLYYYYFGDPIINQKNYITSEIRSLCKRLTVGIVVRPTSYYVDNGIPAIRSLNIRKEGLTDAQMVFISEKDNNSIHKKTQLRAGDVISVRSGRPGTSCIVPPSYDGVNSIDILILTPDSRQITSEYLCAFLNSPGGTQIVQKESRGQVQKHLNVKSLSKSKIPIPSIETQNKFKASLYKFNNLKNSLERKKAQLVALEKALIDSLLNQQS